MHSEKKAAIVAYAVVLFLCLVWVGGTILAPLLEARGAHITGESSSAANSRWLLAGMCVRALYHLVCHQLPERSIWLGSHPIAVCARCFGIYLGYLLGLIVYPWTGRFAKQESPGRIWLVLSMIPIGADFAGGYLGLFENSAGSRIATGLIAGFACVFYTMPGLVATAITLLRKSGRFGAFNNSLHTGLAAR